MVRFQGMSNVFQTLAVYGVFFLKAALQKVNSTVKMKKNDYLTKRTILEWGLQNSLRPLSTYKAELP